VDDIVGEVKLDGVEWEIGVRDLFGKDHVAVTVVTGESSGVVGLNGQRPELERLVGYGLVMRLGEGDFVEKPVGAGVFGEVLRAFGVEDAAVEAMAKELFAAGELSEVGGAERLFALRIGLHDDLLCRVLAAQDRRSWRESRPERTRSAFQP